MIRPLSLFSDILRALLIVIALFAPMIAMQSVEAGSQAIIENSRTLSSGAGLVLVVSLQRV
jgi:hypothetical protein